MIPPCFSTTQIQYHSDFEYSPSLENIRIEMRIAILSLYSHFLYGEQEIFLSFFPFLPTFYPVLLDSFPNKLWYYF
jgi:hypothetical protein